MIVKNCLAISSRKPLFGAEEIPPTFYSIAYVLLVNLGK